MAKGSNPAPRGKRKPKPPPGPPELARGEAPDARFRGARAVEMLPVARLLPYAKNARTHSEQQVLELARGMEKLGFNNPVLIDKQGSIVAGHGRVLAAEKLGEKLVPCVRLEHLSDDEVRAYRLADNRIAEMSEWDYAVLAPELASMRDALGTDGLGWSDAEAAAVISAQQWGTDDGTIDEGGPDEADRVSALWKGEQSKQLTEWYEARRSGPKQSLADWLYAMVETAIEDSDLSFAGGTD